MALDIRPLKPTSNTALLDAIRNEGSNDYQRRISAASKAGVQQTLKDLQTHRTMWNEFLDALVNRIGLVVARNKVWSNPLSEFKQGLLSYGDTIEEIQIGLLKAKSYDPDREYLEKDLFGTERPDVQANFHKVNRQDYYKITINEPLLQRAFLENGGLSSFVSQLMDAPTTSDQWDEFLLTCQLFSEYESNGGFFKVNVPDVASLESNAADARAVLRKMRAMADTLTFMSTRYNAARMPTFALRDDLVLFVTPEFKAAVDVEALAAAFNLNMADMYGRIIPIPEEQFGIAGVQAIMTTKDFFVIADQRIETASQWNPVALHNNYFLHHWQVISASRFVPAVMFTTQGGDEIINVLTPVVGVSAITGVDSDGDAVTDEVLRGEVYAFHAEAETDPANGVNTGVRWSVSGYTSSRTYISRTGVLHVGGDEGAATLTVTATSTWLDADNLRKDGATETLTLDVAGVAVPEWPESDPVTGITVDGVAVTPAFAAGTFAYTVDLAPGATITPDDVEVTGPEANDVEITVNEAGTVATISVPTAPGDPVYTVTVA
jgi:hypothetical protein